jgi:thiol-disulfide isomerase/thioredoxin
MPKKNKSSNPDPIAAPPPNAQQPAGQPFWLNTPNNNLTNPTAPPNSVPSINSGVSAIDSASTADPNATGVLAGRVVDAFNRPAGVAIVQVQPAGGGNAPARTVETTPQGHFVIHGLQNGQSYRLLAKSKAGMRPMVGEAIVRTPDARILIPVSEDYVSPTSPTSDGNYGPPVTPPVAELGQPRAAGEFYPAAPESIAGTDAGLMPKANIPPFGLPETGATAVPKVNAISGPVPDCLVGGGRVLTLRLQDPEGRVWDFSQRQGRLVLLDFWGSWCTPCLRSIPELIRLQSAYRSSGLEVIGIACEKESAADNVARVQRVRRLMPTINYRILMAGEPNNDPVRAQFRPTAYPHLVLLDADGTILWRGSGGDSITELEAIIRDRLARP